MIEQEIRLALLASTSITSIVGDRIAALVMPEGEARPYIVYQLISGTRPGSLCGAGSVAAVRNARVQVSCFAPHYGTAKQLAALVELAMAAYFGHDAVYNGDQDLYDPATKLSYVALDFSIWR